MNRKSLLILISLSFALFPIFGYAASIIYTLENVKTITPDTAVTLESGTVGFSEIGVNGTTAEVNNSATTPIHDFVDSLNDIDESTDKGTHSNFTTQKYKDLIYDTLTERVGSISAEFSGTKTIDDSTDMNQGSLTLLKFDSHNYDPDYFTNDTSNPSRLIIKSAGDYWFSFIMPLHSTSARVNIEAQVFKNGIKQNVGVTQCSYIRSSTGHYDSSDHLTFFLKDLTGNDYIEIKVQGEANTGTVTVNDRFTLFGSYVEDADVFYAIGNQTTGGTDFSTTSEYPIKWNTEVIAESGYTHDAINSPENITIDQSGIYLVSVNIPLYSTTARANVKGIVKLDGTKVTGGELKQGYIRATNNHDHASIHWTGIVNATSNNQVLTVTTQEEGASATVTAGGENGTIYIQKLSTSGVFFASGTQIGDADNWNPSTKAQINLTSHHVYDSNYYSHDTGTNNQKITIHQTGDYLLLFSGAFVEGSGNETDQTEIRACPKATVQVNTIDVSGAIGETGYIRDDSGHGESSDTIVFPLFDLFTYDNITISMEAGSDQTASVNDTSLGIVCIVYLTPSTPNYQLDLEVQFTAVTDFLPTEKLCIYTGTTSDEDIRVDYWNGTGWENVTPDLNANAWNNYTVSLTSTTYTIRFNGGSESSDISEDQWQIDAALLRVEGFGSLEDAVDNDSSDVDDSVDRGTLSDFVNLTTKDGMANLTEVEYVNLQEDFFIQRGYVTIPTSENSVTITAGTNYTAPSSLSRAFIRIVSTRLTGSGYDNGGGTQDPSEHMASIINPENLLTSISFQRYDSPTGYNTRVYWEIIEYIGLASGANEFIVRDQGELECLSGNTQINTSIISGISDDGDVVVFITGQRGSQATSSTEDHALFTAEWIEANDIARFTRGDNGSVSKVSYAVVEFTGLNWEIQQEVSHTYFASGTWEIETISPVNVSSTFLHVQMRTESGALDEQGQQVYLYNSTTIYFKLRSGANVLGQVAVAWIVENTLINSSAMKVDRFSDTRLNSGSEPEEFTFDISTASVSKTYTTSIMGETADSSGTGNAVPRGNIGFILDNVTQVKGWRSDTGQNQDFRFEVVQWPKSTTDSSYQLDQEIQWTSVHYDLPNEELCIYGGTMADEDILVDVWNGTGWKNVFTDLSSGWNNASISSYLNASTFTIRFHGGTEIVDNNPDSWEIDITLIHVDSGGRIYDYILNATSKKTYDQNIRLHLYNYSNIDRLRNCTIWFQDSTTSTQINITNGVVIQDVGPWYLLPDSETRSLVSYVEESVPGTSLLYIRLEAVKANSIVYTCLIKLRVD